LGIHPTEGHNHHELYQLCDDVRATVDELKGKGVGFSRPISDEGFGLVALAKVPGGGEIGIYEPRHPTAI
jgi:hypothetical protein